LLKYDIFVFVITISTTCEGSGQRPTFPLVFFTAALTCYCSGQKIFTRPDGCETLLKVFVISITRIFAMKSEELQLRVSSLVSAGAFKFLRGCALAQLRGNIGHYPPSMETPVHYHVHKRPQIQLKLHLHSFNFLFFLLQVSIPASTLFVCKDPVAVTIPLNCNCARSIPTNCNITGICYKLFFCRKNTC
jgi:hypothetical protein